MIQYDTIYLMRSIADDMASFSLAHDTEKKK